MHGSPNTRPSLLMRLRNARDEEAWRQFVEIYAPLVHAYARKNGMQDADAADLTQEVLRKFVAVSHEFAYDPERGSFRSWLLTVVRNYARDQWARRSRVARGTGDSTMLRYLEGHASSEDDVPWWEEQHERRLVEHAADRVRSRVQPSTWQAFRRTALGQEEASDVARELDMSVAAVYLAKARVIKKLQQEVRSLQRGIGE